MPEAVRGAPASDGPLGPVLILLPALPALLLVLSALRALRMTKAPTVLIVCVALCLWLGGSERREGEGGGWISCEKAEALSTTRLDNQRLGCNHD